MKATTYFYIFRCTYDSLNLVRWYQKIRYNNKIGVQQPYYIFVSGEFSNVLKDKVEIKDGAKILVYRFSTIIIICLLSF